MKIKFPLKFKFGFWISFLLVVIVVLIGYTLIEYQREKLTEQVLMRGGVLARNLSVIVLENYTTRDLIPAASYARSLLKEEGVIEAFFITKKGYVLAHSDGEKATMDPEDPKIKWTHYGRSIKPSEEYNKPFFLKGEELKEGEYTYQLYKNKYYDIYSPVISEKALQMRGKEIVKRKYFGDAHIIFSREIIFKAVRQARQRTIYIALGAIALGVLGALALATSIVRPIKKLAQGTAKIGSGELGYKIAIRSKDEIGALASDFNEMTGKLKEAQKVMLDKKRTEREMEIAAEIQNTLLPKSIPKFSNLELAAFYQPAKTVGGDYYDMIPLTNTKIAIVVADVSGKGVPGSLGMTMFRSILRSIIRPDVSAYDTLCRVNELIKPDIPESMFMTAFYGIFDTVTKKFDYAIAGHDPLIVYNSTTKNLDFFPADSPPVGLVDPEVFNTMLQKRTLEVKLNDVIIQYSDGVLEGMNVAKDLYGEERFNESIRKNGHLPIQKIIDNTKADLFAFTKGATQNDDITLIGVKVVG